MSTCNGHPAASTLGLLITTLAAQAALDNAAVSDLSSTLFNPILGLVQYTLENSGADIFLLCVIVQYKTVNLSGHIQAAFCLL